MVAIYKHTVPNGLVYIGKTTKTKNPNERWQGGSGYRMNERFYADIMKYGWDNIQHEILEYVEDEVSDKKEREYILKFKSNEEEFGYNKYTNYLKNKTPKEKPIKSKKMKYRCIETGEEFHSVKEIANKFGKCADGVYKVLKGKRETALNCHWEKI